MMVKKIKEVMVDNILECYLFIYFCKKKEVQGIQDTVWENSSTNDCNVHIVLSVFFSCKYT